MLWMPSLTPAQQRELQHWQRGTDPRLTRRTQVILWSAAAVEPCAGGCTPFWPAAWPDCRPTQDQTHRRQGWPPMSPCRLRQPQQAIAQRSYFKKHWANPPEFEQVRL